MTSIFPVRQTTPTQRLIERKLQGQFLYINGYNMQRIVYELIRNYMLNNTPEECGVTLSQKYDADSTKSGIFIDVAYNWKSQITDKVPAIFVERGDITIGSPTLAQASGYNEKDSEDSRMTINKMPVKVTCIAAQPIAVVENLADYVKQPLVCFRKEVKADFRLRGFELTKIGKPELIKESKTNFGIEMIIDTAYDEGWVVQKDDLKIKTIGMELFNTLTSSSVCPSC